MTYYDFLDTVLTQSRQDTVQISGQIMNYFISLYPKQFKYDYYPVNQKDIIYCDCCKREQRIFIQIQPYDKLICIQCSLDLQLLKNKYPQLSSIQFPSQLVKQILETKVYCPNRYMYQEFYVKTNKIQPIRIKDPQLRMLIDDYNHNKLNRNSVDVQMPQGEDLQLLSNQLNGAQHQIKFFKLIPQYLRYEVTGCNKIIYYRDVQQHLYQCQYSYKQCQYCGYKTIQQFINLHQSTCKHKLVGCPICYKLNIELQNWCDHVTNCIENCDNTVTNEGYNIEEDAELQIKIENVEDKLQTLSERILMWDNQLQADVVNRLKQFQGKANVTAQYSKFQEKIILKLQQIYKNNLLIYCLISQTLEQIILDGLIQTWPNNTYIAAMICLVLQTVNMVAFLSFSIYFLSTQQFRVSTPQWMFLSYIALIIWFSGIYNSLYYIDKNQFAGISTDDQSSLHNFYQFLYFSAIIGGKIGLGDITPSRIFSRFLVLAEAIYSTYILLVWFRGISFFIKIKEIQKFEKNFGEHAIPIITVRQDDLI